MSSHVGEWDTTNTVLCVAVVLFFCAFALVARASRRLLVVDLRDGAVVRARGRAPPGVVGEIEDIARRAQANGRFVVIIEGDSAALRADPSIGEATAQRLRNVVGRFPLARWRNGSKA